METMQQQEQRLERDLKTAREYIQKLEKNLKSWMDIVPRAIKELDPLHSQGKQIFAAALDELQYMAKSRNIWKKKALKALEIIDNAQLEIVNGKVCIRNEHELIKAERERVCTAAKKDAFEQAKNYILAIVATAIGTQRLYHPAARVPLSHIKQVIEAAQHTDAEKYAKAQKEIKWLNPGKVYQAIVRSKDLAVLEPITVTCYLPNYRCMAQKCRVLVVGAKPRFAWVDPVSKHILCDYDEGKPFCQSVIEHD